MATVEELEAVYEQKKQVVNSLQQQIVNATSEMMEAFEAIGQQRLADDIALNSPAEEEE